jgi:hypothetical protein
VRESPVNLSILRLGFGPSQYVQMVLNTAGFDRYIEIYPDLPAALASF